MSRLALVLLPGLLCDARLWRDQAADLADIAETRIADLTRDDTITAMAERVLDAAPPRFALAALSMGGYVAFEIMRRAPERVSRLALFDTSAAADGPEQTARRKAALRSMKLGRFAGVTDRFLPQLIHESRVHGPVGAEVKAMAARVGADAFRRQQQAIIARPDSLPGLGAIRVPSLVAVGDGDRVTPLAQAEAIQRAIPGSRLHVFAACGHLPPLELPAETSALLRDFLSP